LSSIGKSAIQLPASQQNHAATPPPAAYPGGEAPPAQVRWIPIRSLADRHRPRILAHLLSLAPEDRYLRFGHAASDAQIARYADAIDFARDEVFGVFNRRLELIAQAHLASMERSPEAEFGVSVLPHARGRGYGARLFEHAVLHARNRGIDTLVIHALSENTPMLRIARRAGATIERAGSDALARLRLPPDDVASHMSQWFGDSVAEFDYHLKAHARRIDSLLGAFAAARTRAGSAPGRPAGD
jgi:RimJ/RimL family protein N-acetyltransferase